MTGVQTCALPISNPNDPSDDLGHGTHVAGIIGAVGNNGLGVVGVAWQVKLMACKFLSPTAGSESDAVECFDYARTRGAKVINASFVAPVFLNMLYPAITNCRAAGIIFVCAAGNDQINNDVTPYYPASFKLDNIVAVTSTDGNDMFASSFSNYGATNVHLAAPGVGLYSTSSQANNSYGYYAGGTGTSFSAPYVSGALALMIEIGRASCRERVYSSV